VTIGKELDLVVMYKDLGPTAQRVPTLMLEKLGEFGTTVYLSTDGSGAIPTEALAVAVEVVDGKGLSEKANRAMNQDFQQIESKRNLSDRDFIRVPEIGAIEESVQGI
jgi:hypothetical protein